MQRTRQTGSSHRRRRGPVRATAAPSKQAVEKRPRAAAAGELSFRARTLDDDAYIVQLTEEQLGTVHQQSFGEPFPREQFSRYLQSGAPTFVIERDGKRIGYYSYLLSHDGRMHISAMVVESNYQSDGVGTRVMQHLEQEAVHHGVHTMEVFVQAQNEGSIAFTQKLGFSEAFRLPPGTICFQKSVSGQPAAGMQPPGAMLPPQEQGMEPYPFP